MGCWNKTCGLSNLHITSGTRVYTFVLEQNPHHDRCYSTAFWRPVMIPFLTTYNDYGGGENSHKNIEYILQGLREQLVEMPLGDNEYHDIEITAEKLDEELFFEAVHEGRLKVGDRFGGSDSLVDFVMMRTDIVDSICENWVREQYVGDGEGTGGWGNNYNFYKFEDLVVGVPEFIDKLMGELNDTSENDVDSNLPTELRLKYALFGLSGLYDYDDHNLVSSYLRGIDDYRFSRIVRPSDEVVKLAASGHREEAEALLVDILRATFINAFMEQSRKLWIPGCHEGSQSAEHSPYRVLCAAITTVLDDEVKEGTEWEEE